MRTTITLTGLAVLAVLGWVLLGGGGTGVSQAGQPAAQDKEVSKNPALLISPTLKAGELSVYGVKLGAAAASLPSEAGVSAEGIPDRQQDMIYVGRNVRYYANDGKIYRISIMGDLAKQLPPYDAARLQIALGKADETIESPTGEDARLSFFARHVRYTVHAYRSISLVSEVDLYEP